MGGGLCIYLIIIVLLWRWPLSGLDTVRLAFVGVRERADESERAAPSPATGAEARGGAGESFNHSPEWWGLRRLSEGLQRLISSSQS